MTAYVGKATGYSFVPAKGSDNTKTLAEVTALSWKFIGAARGKENDSRSSFANLEWNEFRVGIGLYPSGRA